MTTHHTTLSPLASPLTATTEPVADPRGGGALVSATRGGDRNALSSHLEILGSEVFVLSEPLLAAALGLPLRTIGNMRVKKLTRDRDWKLDGITVLMTQKSLPLLTDALGLNFTPAELQLLAEKIRHENAPVEFKALVHKFPANPKLLTVRWVEAGGLERTANIITNRRNNFRNGMEVPIRLNPGTQRYELARPAPRMKGRW